MKLVIGGMFATACTGPGVTYDGELELEAVNLDPAGCPVGGSLRATIRYDDPANGASTDTSPSFDISGAVRFGPSCGS